MGRSYIGLSGAQVIFSAGLRIKLRQFGTGLPGRGSNICCWVQQLLSPFSYFPDCESAKAVARFFDPQGRGERLHAPATARNRKAIFDVLQSAQPPAGTLFEVASGTGEHAAFMAPKLTGHLWQPSDIENHHLASINAWRREVLADNILPARVFNIRERDFDEFILPARLSAVLAFNLIHISPWQVAEALITKAGAALPKGGLLYLYGPYKQGGEHTAVSNAEFDASLKSRDTSWGVRDMEAVIELAVKAGLNAPEITAMPANNFSLVFRK